MPPLNKSSSFREYCLRHFQELHHPAGGTNESLDLPDLEASLDIIETVLTAAPSPTQMHGLETQFYSAFEAYLTLPRSALGDLLNAVDKLSNLIDPFVKKIAFCFLPAKTVLKKIKGTERPITLWKSPNYGDTLEALNILAVSDLYKDKNPFWQAQGARKAILREGFTSRQKGSHESRARTLAELERAAYCIIGQYIVICLYLLQDSGLSEQLRGLTEKTRASYLLRDRAKTFSLTGTLLSLKEHILIYKHRANIMPDQQEKKYLFLNYLAHRGPCTYWLAPDEAMCLEWAGQAWQTTSDPIVRKNATRFLLLHGQVVPLTKLLEVFDEYSDKTELAGYMERCFGVGDSAILLKLSADKREEVALEARRLLPRVFQTVDEEIRQLGRSTSGRKLGLLKIAARGIATAAQLEHYRSFAEVHDGGVQTVYIYCLGEIGTDADAVRLRAFTQRPRLRQAARAACWYAVARIYDRERRITLLERLLKSRAKTTSISALEAIEESGPGDHLWLVLKLASRNVEARKRVSAALFRLATLKDRAHLREYLRKWGLDDTTRDAVLTLCRIGSARECRFLLKLIAKNKGQVRLFNHVRIADALARTASKSMTRRLKQHVICPEFWNYIHPSDHRALNRLPVDDVENQALCRRLIAACFLKVAGPGERSTVRRLMDHNYDWIAHKAGQRFAEIGRPKDLEALVTSLLSLSVVESTSSASILDALIMLDERLYSAKRKNE